MAKLIWSAFSDEYSQDLVEQCKALNGYGIGYMEARGVNGKNISTLTKAELSDTKKTLDDYGIKVSAIGSPLGKISINDDMAAHIDMAKRVCETANELSAKYVRVFSFYFPKEMTREQCKGQVFDNLEKLIRVSEEYGVTFCHENEAKIYGETYDKCLEIMEYFGGRMKAVLDMGNFVLDGCDPEKAYETLKEYIEYFHIKDSLYAGAIVPPGKGEAKIKEILERYQAEGKKDTFITLEPHLQTFSGLHALVGKAFENPYKYENQQIAFTDAVEKLRGLL